MEREKLFEILFDYFDISVGSYTYDLTRSKSGFELGTVLVDDFVEWDESNISELCDYILERLKSYNLRNK